MPKNKEPVPFKDAAEDFARGVLGQPDFKLKKAPTVIDETKNIGLTIDSMLKVHARAIGPMAALRFNTFCARMRSMAQETRGFSTNKVMLHVGEIPPKIFYLMNKLFGVEWRNKPEVARTFFRRVAAWRVNDTTVPMTRPEWVDNDRYGEAPPKKTPTNVVEVNSTDEEPLYEGTAMPALDLVEPFYKVEE